MHESFSQATKRSLVAWVGFPHSSAGKESSCRAGDPGSVPGSGRSTGEGIAYPLQHSWASLVAQLVKNPPAMWEIWVRSLGWEDPLEKGKATNSSILAWRIPWTIHGSQRVGHNWVTFTFTFHHTQHKLQSLKPMLIMRYMASLGMAPWNDQGTTGSS